MKKRRAFILCFIAAIALYALSVSAVHAAEALPVSQAEKKPAAAGTEISTAEFKQILLAGEIPVIDVRPEKEYEISHIPGSIHIFETEIDRMTDVCTTKGMGVVLYCNGPYCGKTGRVAEGLSKKRCTKIKKYQDGLPAWRALGNTAETSLPGFRQVFSLDKAAVFVDARSKEEFKTGSVPCAVNLQANEIDAANDDGRLPYTDHGTRLIVFGASPDQARQLAEAIAHRAYWNSSYLAATYDDLKRADLWQ